MFKESPFQGACAWATYEVLVMLVGTFLLGLVLGYLIWGWLRGKVAVLEEDLRKATSLSRVKDNRIAALTTRIASLTDENERIGTKYSLSDYKLKRVQDELAVLQTDQAGGASNALSWSGEEPTLADLTHAMESRQGELDFAEEKRPDVEGENAATESPGYGISPASLQVAEEVFGIHIKAEDLGLIRGIGPKIEEILLRAEISDWRTLAQTPIHTLRQILEEAGPRYRDIDPRSWPVQARMATHGEWRKLHAYQQTIEDTSL